MWQDQTLETHAPRLHYCHGGAAGSGRSICWLHGVLRSWNVLLPLMSPLASRYASSALDHRGHGNSARADRYLVVDYAADAAAWLRQTASQPVVLYGHSLGAMVAAAVAAECPELVRGVVLEDPPFQTMGRRIGETSFLSYFQQIAALLTSPKSTAALAAELAEVQFRDPISGRSQRLGDLRDATSLRFFASTLRRMDPRVLEPIVASAWLDGYDLQKVFSALRMPVLVLQADAAAGGMLMDDDVTLLKQLAAEVLHIRFAGVGHSIAWQRTQDVLNLTLSFLESLEWDQT